MPDLQSTQNDGSLDPTPRIVDPLFPIYQRRFAMMTAQTIALSDSAMRKKKSPKREAAPNETVEVGLKVAEALVSSVPIAGGFLGALFELLSIPLSQRKQRWLDELAEVLSELRDRVSELSKPLEQNQDLLTAILVATPAAIRTQRSHVDRQDLNRRERQRNAEQREDQVGNQLGRNTSDRR